MSTSVANALELAAVWIGASSSAVVLTGAGISTDSGIPDFRSPGGVWSKSQPVYFEEFLNSSTARYEYWRPKAAMHPEFVAAQPNPGHETLAKWQQTGLIQRVMTQNIDGLHDQAGSARVLELHGTARHVSCLSCQAKFEANAMVDLFLARNKPPDCPHCGGLTKHATVSFGQGLSEQVLADSMELSQQADLFLAIGSSLVVQPAASLPRIAREHGARFVIINRDPTPLDLIADAVIHASISETLVELDRLLGE